MVADLLSHYKEEDQERCDRQPSNLLSSELHKHCINQNGTYITFSSNFQTYPVISMWRHVSCVSISGKRKDVWGNMLLGYVII